MTDQQAPERLFAAPRGSKCVVSFTTPSDDYNVEYLRKDLHDAAIKQRDELAEALKWYSEDPSSQGDVARAALRALAAQTGGE